MANQLAPVCLCRTFNSVKPTFISDCETNQEGKANLAQFGLDKPVISLRVSNGQATSQVLQIGKKSPDGNYYAQGAPDAVFEVQPFVFTDFDVRADAFRDTSAPKK